MRCLFCSSENKDTAKFCVRCGKKVPRCPTCGNAILGRARFCKFDGTRIPEEILSIFPDPEAPKEPEIVPAVVPIVTEEAPVAEPEPIVVPEPVVIPEPVVEPEPIVIQEPVVVPEPIVVPEPVVEHEPFVVPIPVAEPELVMEQVPVVREPEPLPIRYCVKCGDVCTDGMKLCAKCRRKAEPKPAVTEYFCVRCGKPREPDQKLCPDCREKEAAGKKSRRMTRLVIVLLILLLITAGIAGALIWRELSRKDEADPGAAVQTTADRNDHEEDRYDDPVPTTAVPTEAPTTVPTEAPTTVPTTAPTEAPDISTPLGYWVEYCDMQYLTTADLALLNEEECRLARNAIFAKSGRMFKDEALQTYFAQFSWYVPRITPESFSNSMLNEFQLYNLDLILAYEESRGYR